MMARPRRRGIPIQTSERPGWFHAAPGYVARRPRRGRRRPSGGPPGTITGVPTLKPFRGLRYAASLGPDLSDVLCPPYDIIPPVLADELLARDPANAVRVELPRPEPGGDDDTRYRSAARALAEWRTAGILVKERTSAVYVHEMRWPDGGLRTAGRARGVFARLRLEAFGAGSGVRPHERTMTGPKEDRYRLLKATGVNLSPVILLAARDATTSEILDRVTAGSPDVTARTDDGVEHRLWVVDVPGTGGDAATGGAATDDVAEDGTQHEGALSDGAALLAAMSREPLTIADGHHRYETALRYRAERDTRRACESDPAWDYVLALVYDVAEAPPVLPTHRVLTEGPRGQALLAALGDLVEVEPVADAEALLSVMATPADLPTPDATGTGRIGVVSGDRAAVLRVRPDVFAALEDQGASDASQGLDVVRLALLLGRLGVDAQALEAGGRVTYVKDATEAVAQAIDGGGAATFLLDGPPVTAVTRVAAAGEVMPQKSTFFDPKAPTGLVFGPLEW